MTSYVSTGEPLTLAAAKPKAATPLVPGQSTFGTGSNLIAQQFAPQDSSRLQGAAGMTNAAAANFAGMGMPQTQGVTGPDYSRAMAAMGSIPTGPSMVGFYGGGFGGGGADTQTGKMREMVLADLDKVRSGADRSQLAGDAYNLMVERSQPEFDQRVRQLGQQTAALGRIGSGIYGSNLTDLNTERERELSLSRRELANQAAGSTLADRLNILGASQSVAGDIAQGDARMAGLLGAANANANADQWRRFDAGMDQARFLAGLADSDYGARFAERGYGDQRSDVGFDRSRSQFTTLADYEQGVRGNERIDRDELRGERGYQYGLDRDARGDFERDRAWQYGTERDKLGDQERWFDRAYEHGYGANPTGVQQYASGQYQQSGQAGMQGGADALGEYLYQQHLRNRPPVGGASPQYPGQPYNGQPYYDPNAV